MNVFTSGSIRFVSVYPEKLVIMLKTDHSLRSSLGLIFKGRVDNIRDQGTEKKICAFTINAEKIHCTSFMQD